jgi:DNA polymerase III subunit delta'
MRLSGIIRRMPWSIIGHEWAVTLLRQSFTGGRVSHAYLFSGPPQVGKTTLARLLAQALNCTGNEAPCGECASCRKIARGTHPDVQVVAGRGVGGSLLIDQVRALRRDASLAPYEARTRVLILRQMDRATPEACNSLLKTLEEPPAHLVLVLTADRRELLLPTIVSRCQCLELRPVAAAAIRQALEARGVVADRAGLLAHLAAGRVGWALLAGEDESLLRRRQQELDLLFSLFAAGRVDRLDAAWKISRDGEGARRLVEVWSTCGRDLLLLCTGDAAHVVNTDQLDRLVPLWRALSLSQAWAMLRALRETAQQLEENVNVRLALEGLLLKLPYAQPATRQV